MNRKLLDTYICPLTKSRLTVSGVESADLENGELVSEAGEHYQVRNGVPIFLTAGMLSEIESRTQAEYDESADQKYDAAVDWLFQSFYEDEDRVREGMIDLLQLRQQARVLEIGSGTGRDSFRIARRLGEQGRFFVQDLSEQMVLKTHHRLEGQRESLGLSAAIEYFVSTVRFLPFPDGYFDAIFHFGGFNNFSEPKKALAEMTRVVKQDGHVVFGDEALPPWLEGTEFGEIIVTNNPLFKHHVPLDCLPENARDVTLRWILGGCFYLFDYKVGDGPPAVDLDLPHKGWRGGTMRTRYYGRLEGITPEARDLAIAAARTKQVSVHEWLDRVVKKTAEADLADPPDVRDKTSG